MARPRKGYRLAFGLFLAGLVAFIWVDSADRGIEYPTARLRNGATVALVGITRSAPHRFTLGNPMQRLVRCFMPATTWEWLGGHSEQVDLDHPVPEVIWFRYRQDRPTSFMDEERIYIADEHGCRSDGGQVVGMSQSSGGMTPGSSHIDDLIPVPLLRYPHRGHGLKVEFASPFYSPPGKPDAAFDIPTPPQVPMPQWASDPLPVSRQFGGAKWTLTSFRTGLKWSSSSKNENYWLPETEARIQVDPPEMLGSGWQIKEMRVIDAAGDTFPDRPDLVTQNAKPGHSRLGFMGDLFPEEPAWKVHLELARGPAAHFAPNKLWTIQHIPFSTAPAAQPFEAKVTMSGVPLTCNGVGGFRSDYAIYLVATTLDSNLTVTIIELRDDRGRRLRTMPDQDRRMIGFQQGYTAFHLPFERKGGERWLNVTLAVQRTQPLEFLVAPLRPHNP